MKVDFPEIHLVLTAVYDTYLCCIHAHSRETGRGSGEWLMSNQSRLHMLHTCNIHATPDGSPGRGLGWSGWLRGAVHCGACVNFEPCRFETGPAPDLPDRPDVVLVGRVDVTQ